MYTREHKCRRPGLAASWQQTAASGEAISRRPPGSGWAERRGCQWAFEEISKLTVPWRIRSMIEAAALTWFRGSCYATCDLALLHGFRTSIDPASALRSSCRAPLARNTRRPENRGRVLVHSPYSTRRTEQVGDTKVARSSPCSSMARSLELQGWVTRCLRLRRISPYRRPLRVRGRDRGGT
jgi:hypothetical protein